MATDAEHLFIHILSIYIISLRTVYWGPLPISFLFFLKIYLFIRKSDIQRGGETVDIQEKERSSIWWFTPQVSATVNAMLIRSQDPGTSHGLGPSSTAFPGHKQGAGWEVELLVLEPAPIWDPSAFKARTLAASPHRRALKWVFVVDCMDIIH